MYVKTFEKNNTRGEKMMYSRVPYSVMNTSVLHIFPISLHFLYITMGHWMLASLIVFTSENWFGRGRFQKYSLIDDSVSKGN